MEILPFLPARLLPAISREVRALAGGCEVSVAHLHGAVLFLDVKGYSALAAGLARADEASASEELITILNSYLSPVIGELHRHGAEVRAAACALAVRAVAAASPAAKAGSGLLLHQGSAWARSSSTSSAPGPPTPSSPTPGKRCGKWPPPRPAPAAPHGAGRCACGAGALPEAEGEAVAELVAGCREALRALSPVPVRRYEGAASEVWSWSLNQVITIFASFPELDLAAPLHAMRRRLQEEGATGTTPHASRLGQIVEKAHQVADKWRGSLYKVPPRRPPAAARGRGGAGRVGAADLVAPRCSSTTRAPPSSSPGASRGGGENLAESAERAARAALDLEAAFGGSAGAPFAAGLAAGRTFCGSLGASCRKEFALIGSALNMAARLMNLAWGIAGPEVYNVTHQKAAQEPGATPRGPRPGAVFCDESIVDALAERAEAATVAFHSYGPVALKGWPEPVPVYWPTLGAPAPEAGAMTTRGRRPSVSARRMSLGPGPSQRRVSLSPLPPRISFASGMPSVHVPPSEAPAPAPEAEEEEEELCVGREAELEAVAGALEALAGRGVGATFLIEGEAGIGKSTLAARAAALVRERGGRVLAGYCNSLEGGLPLWPLRGLVASCAETSSEAALAESLRALGAASGIEAALLWRALFASEARGRPGAGAGSAEAPGTARRLELIALSDALAHVMRTLATATRPLAVVIEDCQQCDAATWTVLRRLRRACPFAIMILTLRTEDGRPPELAGWCRRRALAADDPLHRPAPRPLDRPDAMRLVETLAARERADVPPLALLELVNKAEGNPLFLSELFRQAADAEAAAGDNPGAISYRRRPSIGPGDRRPSVGGGTDGGGGRRGSMGATEGRRPSIGATLSLETAGSTTARGRPSARPSQALPAPAGRGGAQIEQMLLARVDKLPVVQQAVARLAAVAGIGTPFSLEALQAADPTGLDADKLAAALQQLCRDRILRVRPARPRPRPRAEGRAAGGGERGVGEGARAAGGGAAPSRPPKIDDAEGPYVFVHALWQESIYDAMPMAQRRAAHAAVAGWMEGRGAAARSRKERALVALHLLSGEAGERALPLVLEAGEAAEAAGALRDAAALYGGAAALLDALRLAGAPAPRPDGLDPPSRPAPPGPSPSTPPSPAPSTPPAATAPPRPSPAPPRPSGGPGRRAVAGVRARALRLWARAELAEGRYGRAEAIVEEVLLPATPAAAPGPPSAPSSGPSASPPASAAPSARPPLPRRPRRPRRGPGEGRRRRRRRRCSTSRGRGSSGRRAPRRRRRRPRPCPPPRPASPRLLALHARARAALGAALALRGEGRRAGAALRWAEAANGALQERSVEAAVALAAAQAALAAGRLEEALAAADRAAALAPGCDPSALWEAPCVALCAAGLLGRHEEAQLRAERAKEAGEKAGARGFFPVAGALALAGFVGDDDTALSDALELADATRGAHGGEAPWWATLASVAAAGLHAWRASDDLPEMAAAARECLALWREHAGAASSALLFPFGSSPTSPPAPQHPPRPRHSPPRRRRPRAPLLRAPRRGPRAERDGAAGVAALAPSSAGAKSERGREGAGGADASLPAGPREAAGMAREALRLLAAAAPRSPPLAALRALAAAQLAGRPAALAAAAEQCRRARLPFLEALARRSLALRAGRGAGPEAELALQAAGIAPEALRAHDRLYPL
eukprot:tig00021537_g22268.t1